MKSQEASALPPELTPHRVSDKFGIGSVDEGSAPRCLSESLMWFPDLGCVWGGVKQTDSSGGDGTRNLDLG